MRTNPFQYASLDTEQLNVLTTLRPFFLYSFCFSSHSCEVRKNPEVLGRIRLRQRRLHVGVGKQILAENEHQGLYHGLAARYN